MVIRPLRWSDFADFVDLYYSRYEEVEHNPELGVLTRPIRPSLGEEATVFGRFQKGILEGRTVALVAEEGGRVVGVATVDRKGDHVEDAHIGVLGIAIRPESRGKGIGDRLLSELVAACRGKFEILQLAVIEANERALRLYRKHGFEVYGKSPRSFKRRDRYFDEILMWRTVS